jgi:uncharacterized membrane protein
MIRINTAPIVTDRASGTPARNIMKVITARMVKKALTDSILNVFKDLQIKFTINGTWVVHLYLLKMIDLSRVYRVPEGYLFRDNL